MRTIRRVGTLGLVVVVAFFALPRRLLGCLEIPTPNPAAAVLYVLATGPTVEALAKAIEEGGQPGVQRFDRKPRVGWVLSTYARMGDSQRQLVLDALSALKLSASSLVREEASEFSACIESEALCGYSPRPVVDALKAFRELRGIRPGDGPPTHTDRAHAPENLFAERLLLYLDGLLPRERQARIEACLRALAAVDCDDFLAGRASDVCRDLSLWEMKFSSMHVLIAEIMAGPELSGLVQLVTEADKATSARVDEYLASAAAACCGCGAYELQVMILEWRRSHPSELKAWCDIEGLFRPSGMVVLGEPPAATPAPGTSHERK
ncbi:MAG: hypothetical protein MUF10_01615 [Thermoanaerobaculaceae bacterium]|jgi:hypothetical protein|nr:hypothetical protein [Thermoanaerobaculaceae bacterium]